MLIRQAFRFRLREQPAQAREYARTAGCCRFVWNKALALQQRYYRLFGKHLSYNKLANRLPRWKRRHPFLTEAPSQALQQTLKDLDTAWSRFFKEPQRVGRPRFKGRDTRAAFRLPQSVELDTGNARVRLAKLGWVRLRLSRDVPGQIKNATVSREREQWFVSLQTERDADVVPRTGSAVGVDVGAARAATATDGQILLLEAKLSKQAARLRYLQRCLSRKQKGSRRRQRAKNRLAAVHARLSRIRSDAVHKLSRSLANRHAVVCLENLQVAAMTAAGAIEKRASTRVFLRPAGARYASKPRTRPSGMVALSSRWTRPTRASAVMRAGTLNVPTVLARRYFAVWPQATQRMQTTTPRSTSESAASMNCCERVRSRGHPGMLGPRGGISCCAPHRTWRALRLGV